MGERNFQRTEGLSRPQPGWRRREELLQRALLPLSLNIAGHVVRGELRDIPERCGQKAGQSKVTFPRELFSRSRVVLICKIGTAVSLLTVLATFAWSDSYLARLAACFLLFLFVFHWLFGAKHNLTATQVRMIDYAYLGIAALGIFLFALNQEEKRYEYVQLEVQDEGRRQLERSRLNLANGLIDLERAACMPATVQRMPQYCERVKQLKVAFAAEDASETNMKYSVTVNEYLASVSPPSSSDQYSTQLYRQIESANERLKSLELSVRIAIQHIKIQAPLPPDDIRDSTYGLFTWPFILAFAFALRITKTTIEVLGWTTQDIRELSP